MIRALVSLFVAVTAAAPSLVPASETEEIGIACEKGLVPDELSRRYANDASASFRDALCGSWYEDHQTLIETQAGLEVFDLFAFDAKHNDSVKKVTRNEFCADKSLAATDKTRVSFWSRVYGDAREKWLECVKAFTQTNAGRWAPVVVSVSNESWNGFALLLKPVAPDVTTSLKSLEGENVRCDKRRVKRLSPMGETVTCTWTAKVATSGLVVIRTDRGSMPVGVVRPTTGFGSAELELTRTVPVEVDKGEVCGRTVESPWLHEARWRSGCVGSQQKWCFKTVQVSVGATAPNRVLRNPVLKCTSGACGWNGGNATFVIGDGGRGTIVRNDQRSIVVTTSASSYPTGIKLCATEYELGTSVEKRVEGPWTLVPGRVFVVTVPKTDGGVVKITTSAGHEAITAGADSDSLKLVNTASSAADTYYTYRVPQPQM